VIWWRGLHQGPTIGDPSKVLNPSAPLQFVLALLAMLAAFTMIWIYLLIRRYQLARLDWQREEDLRRGLVLAARQTAPGVGAVEEPAR